MASVMRLSRFTKIAAISAIGGSFYLLRDEIKPYINLRGHDKERLSKSLISPIVETRKIENLPEQVPYLLVGGGTASHSAMRAIRGHDPKAKVLIIGSENHLPYMRPALSKELWSTDKETRRNLHFRWWNGKNRSIFYEIDEFFIPIGDLDKRENGGVSFIKNTRLDRLDPDNKLAHLETGQTIKYDKCLLAPGGKPKTLPQLDAASKEVRDRIIYFRTADDFLKLEQISETAKRILVIGGGFLGSELTFSLTKHSSEDKALDNQIIYQIYPETGNLGKVLPQYLSEYVSEKARREGAHLIPNVETLSASMTKENTIDVKLSNGESISVDYIVCAVGLEPDVELAKSSNLEVDQHTGGYLVNSELEARTNVWVAGDASCFYDIKLGRRRVEHHDHAINSGRLAGQNMVGAQKAYNHQPMFWSDLSTDISFEAVGIIDSSFATAAVFAPREETTPVESDKNPSIESLDQDATESSKNDLVKKELSENDRKYDRGVVFYLKDDIIVGILLWNLFTRLTIARRILNEQKKYDDFNEVAKLFNIYLDD